MADDDRRKDFADAIFTHLRPLHLTALWLTKDRSDSKDLVEHTLAKAYRVWHPSISKANLKVLLFKIMTSLYFDGFQQKTKNSMTGRQRACGAGTLQNRFASAESETGDITRRTIVRLPVEIRYVRILTKLAGFSQLEIAKVIGLNPDIMESRAFKGSRLLQSELFTYGEG